MLKAILALFCGCVILNTITAYADESPNHSWNRKLRYLPADALVNHESPMPGLLDDNYMSTKIPPAWNPFVTSSYVLLGENNNTYLDSIKKSVKVNWNPPLCPTTSIVSLEINKDGVIGNVKTLCPSGNQQYDQAALKAILYTHHFACPPKDLRLPVMVTLTFNSDPRLTDAERGLYRSPYQYYLAQPKPPETNQSGFSPNPLPNCQHRGILPSVIIEKGLSP